MPSQNLAIRSYANMFRSSNLKELCFIHAEVPSLKAFSVGSLVASAPRQILALSFRIEQTSTGGEALDTRLTAPCDRSKAVSMKLLKNDMHKKIGGNIQPGIQPISWCAVIAYMGSSQLPVNTQWYRYD